MRLRCLAAVCAAAIVSTLGASARADLLIKVNKSDQRMQVIADGELLYTWRVSTGRRGFNTPSGAFTPFRMDRHHFSREWDDAPMPYSMFFTQQGHAIHGTYEARHLGRAVSHGCVRLSVKHAAILWGLVKEHGKKHTTVLLTGHIPTGRPALVAHRTPRGGDNDNDVTGNIPSHRYRSERHRRARRDAGDSYSYYARQRVYHPQRRYEYRDAGNYRPDPPAAPPPPIFPFILFAPPPGQ